MKFKKLIAAVAAAAMAGSLAVVPAGAALDTNNQETITPTVDTWLRANNNDDHGTNDTMELKTYAADGVDMVGYISFTIPTYEGYSISSASLRLTTERIKGDRVVNLYDISPDIPANAKYSDYSSAISTAKVATAIGSISLAGQSTKCVTSDEITEEKYQTISAWQNTIDISEYVKADEDGKVGLLIARNADANNSNKIFTSEKTDFSNSKSNSYLQNVSADDLVPKLTITYKAKEAKIDSVYYDTFAEAFASAKTGDTIQLLANIENTNDRYVMDSGSTSGTTYRNSNNNITIEGNNHSVSGTNTFLFETNGKTFTLKNITILGGTAETINAKAASNITLKNVTVGANAIATNSDSSSITATDLNVTNAADGIAIIKSGSTLGTVNITLTDALAAEYDVTDGVLKAKTKTSNYAFTSTISALKAKTDVIVTVNTSEGEASASIKDKLPTINGGGELMLGIILNYPSDIIINSVTLK